MTEHRCIAPIDDAAHQLCGARATTSRIVDGLVCHLCSAHAAELDHDHDHDHDQQSEESMINNNAVFAMIAIIAREMVQYYRACGDDLSVADMVDDNAHHADDWDAAGMEFCGVDAGIDRALVRTIVRDYRDDLRDAYIFAWRAAVELELASRAEVAS